MKLSRDIAIGAAERLHFPLLMRCDLCDADDACVKSGHS